MNDSEHAPGPTPKPRFRIDSGFLWGTLSGWVLIFIPYLIALVVRHGDMRFMLQAPMADYTFGLILIMPTVQGLVSGLVRGPAKHTGGDGAALIAALWLTDMVGAGVLLREGVICLIMATPLLWAVMTVG